MKVFCSQRAVSYYFFLALAVASLIALYRFEFCRIGVSLKAIAQSHSVASSVGINEARYRIIAVGVGCFFVGLVGAAYAHYNLVVSPSSFNLLATLWLVMYALVGGMKKFISPGDIVVVKPNIGWDRVPEQAANTNPEVLATVVQLCYEAGAKKVKVFGVFTTGRVSMPIVTIRGPLGSGAPEIGKAIVGQTEIVDGVLVCLFTGGHALLEGVPGLGKTYLIRTLAQALSLNFNRIQFTPDLKRCKPEMRLLKPN
jgi:hypothetical protein